MAGITWGSILMDIEMNEEQGEYEKYRNGNADCYGDPGVMGDTMGRGADGTEAREVGRGMIGENVRRFYGEW